MIENNYLLNNKLRRFLIESQSRVNNKMIMNKEIKTHKMKMVNRVWKRVKVVMIKQMNLI